MLTGKPLRRMIERLRVQSECPSPRKVPRRLKKAWKRAVLERVLDHFQIGPKAPRRFRLHWVPGQGWTVTSRPRVR